MKNLSRRRLNLLLFSIPVVVGLAILILAVASRTPPQRETAGERPLPVRTITVEETDYLPRVVGYGSVQPSRIWQANAEVGGKITERHPDAEPGGLVTRGTLLLRIDPAEYEIAVMRSKGTVRAVRAQLQELDLEAASLEERLILERRNLGLLERERKRNLALVRDGSISETVMERLERDVVRQELAVTTLANNLAIVPARREQLAAQLDQARAGLRDAERRLAQTEIRAPFSGRVAVASLEPGQAVRVGEPLLELHDRDRAEIEVGIAIGKMRDLTAPSETSGAALPNERPLVNEGITASVHLDATEPPVRWPAEVLRLDATLDPATRAVGVIVAVDEPVHDAASGRPPLLAGTFCAVELRGRVRKSLVIPRSAVRDGQVMVVDETNRLAFRTVVAGSGSAEITAILSGLEPGDRVIVSDPEPAVSGMLLEPRNDEALAAAITATARGGAP